MDKSRPREVDLVELRVENGEHINGERIDQRLSPPLLDASTHAVPQLDVQPG